jgi:hypothetical protein
LLKVPTRRVRALAGVGKIERGLTRTQRGGLTGELHCALSENRTRML